jgi:hypothetical protein
MANNLNSQALMAIQPLEDEYMPRFMAAETEEGRLQIEEEFAVARDQLLEDIGYYVQLEELEKLSYQVDATVQEYFGIVLEAVHSVAQELGVDVVLEGDAVMYGGLDMTSKVLDYLNSLRIVTLD